MRLPLIQPSENGSASVTPTEPASSLWGAVLRGCYPHQLSWLIDNPLRRLIISPATLADRLPLATTSRLLEVGPGSGYFSVELARRVPQGHLELLDLQPQMLDKAARKFGKSGPTHVGFTAADACAELPFEEASFDIVLLATVLGELPSPETALRSFHRLLVPGGTMAVHEHLPDPDFMSFMKLRLLAQASGFAFRRRFGPRWNYTALYKRIG